MAFSLKDKLFANKSYSETIEILGRKITFEPLGGQQESEIAQQCPANTFIEYSEMRKIPTLARVIVAIDGQSWKDCEEIQQRLRSDPKPTLVSAVEEELKSPAYKVPVINALYIAYTEVYGRYRQSLDTLKKSSDKTTAASAG